MPTHAELAFQRLYQAAGAVRSDTLPAQTSAKQSLSEGANDERTLAQHSDILTFRGEWKGLPGRLALTLSGIRFVETSSFGKNDRSLSGQARNGTWYRPYTHLKEMSKIHDPLLKIRSRELMRRDALKIMWSDETEDVISTMNRTDEAFNTIIGFSGLRWQKQPPGVDGDDVDRETQAARTEKSSDNGDAAQKSKKKSKVLDELSKF